MASQEPTPTAFRAPSAAAAAGRSRHCPAREERGERAPSVAGVVVLNGHICTREGGEPALADPTSPGLQLGRTSSGPRRLQGWGESLPGFSAPPRSTIPRGLGEAVTFAPARSGLVLLCGGGPPFSSTTQGACPRQAGPPQETLSAPCGLQASPVLTLDQQGLSCCAFGSAVPGSLKGGGWGWQPARLPAGQVASGRESPGQRPQGEREDALGTLLPFPLLPSICLHSPRRVA